MSCMKALIELQRLVKTFIGTISTNKNRFFIWFRPLSQSEKEGENESHF